jgi:hypothetical protein
MRIPYIKGELVTFTTFTALLALAGPAWPAPTEPRSLTVPSLEVVEGEVSGYGTRTSGQHWLTLDGHYTQRVLAPDSRYRDIDYGDVVLMACTRAQCWVWTVVKKEKA